VAAVASQDLVGRLVRDAVYTIQKDAVRVALLALFSVLMRQLRRENNNPAITASVAGGFALLVSLASSLPSSSTYPPLPPLSSTTPTETTVLQWLGFAAPPPPLAPPDAASSGFGQLVSLLWANPPLLGGLLACIYLIDRFDLHMKIWTLISEAAADAWPQLLRLLHLSSHPSRAETPRRGGALVWGRKVSWLLPLPVVVLVQQLAAVQAERRRVAQRQLDAEQRRLRWTRQRLFSGFSIEARRALRQDS